IGTQDRIGTGYGTSRVGVVYVLNGGVASNTVISGSSDTAMVVSSGGLAIGTVVNPSGGPSGGITETFVYGTTSNTVLSGRADERVNSGGRAVGTTVYSGSYQEVDFGGVASGTTVNSGGSITVYGGVVSGLTIAAGATANIDADYNSNVGATVTGNIVNNGI